MTTASITQPQGTPSMPNDANLYECISDKAAQLARTFNEDRTYNNVFMGTAYDIAVETVATMEETMGPFGFGWQIDVCVSSVFWPAKAKRKDAIPDPICRVLPLCTVIYDAQTDKVGAMFAWEAAQHIQGILAAFNDILSVKQVA